MLSRPKQCRRMDRKTERPTWYIVSGPLVHHGVREQEVEDSIKRRDCQIGHSNGESTHQARFEQGCYSIEIVLQQGAWRFEEFDIIALFPLRSATAYLTTAETRTDMLAAISQDRRAAREARVIRLLVDRSCNIEERLLPRERLFPLQSNTTW